MSIGDNIEDKTRNLLASFCQSSKLSSSIQSKMLLTGESSKQCVDQPVVFAGIVISWWITTQHVLDCSRLPELPNRGSTRFNFFDPIAGRFVCYQLQSVTANEKKKKKKSPVENRNNCMLQLYTCTSCRFFFLREANPFYFSYVPSMTKNDVMVKTPLPGLKILFHHPGRVHPSEQGVNRDPSLGRGLPPFHTEYCCTGASICEMQSNKICVIIIVFIITSIAWYLLPNCPVDYNCFQTPAWIALSSLNSPHNLKTCLYTKG